MSARRHTPRRWVLKTTIQPRAAGERFSLTVRYVRDADGQNIARLLGSHGDAEEIADGRLLAAAPALADCLSDAIGTLEEILASGVHDGAELEQRIADAYEALHAAGLAGPREPSSAR